MLDYIIMSSPCSVRKCGLVRIVTCIHVHTLCQKSLDFSQFPVPRSNCILNAKRKMVHVMLLEKILKTELLLKVK
jgi:hypothetical protein